MRDWERRREVFFFYLSHIHHMQHIHHVQKAAQLHTHALPRVCVCVCVCVCVYIYM